MDKMHSLDDLRKKAHKVNCTLVDEDFDPREIEIIGYYLKRIAASYLSYHTHKELRKTEEKKKDISPEKKYEKYGEYS